MPSVVMEPSVRGKAAFTLRIPMPKMLTAKEELEMARAAYARQPESPHLRYRLANMLARLDHFDEAVDLLQRRPVESVRELHLLSTVLLNRESAADDAEARKVAERALEISQTPQEKAATLTQLAKIHTRLHNLDRAKELLRHALAEDPHEKDAYKRLFRHLLQEDAEAARAFAQDAIDHEVLHARVLGSLPLALTHLGRYADARRAEGADEFLKTLHPAPPSGWDSIEAFNEGLANEALNHPDMRYDRYGVASARTWRLDAPALHRTNFFPQLQQLIKREVDAYVASLPVDGPPFARAMPREATLRNWTVITEGDGYETWHVHQNGWLSGVYYIHVPDHIANGTGPEGCIAFGLPDDILGREAAAAFGETIVRPHSGMMMVFPSHVFHRTYPHNGSGRRICYAFDLVPYQRET